MTNNTSVDLVFDEMKDRLRRQEAILDEVRSRGGVSWILLPPEWYRRYLAEYMADWIRDNQEALDPLYGRLEWAIRAAAVGIVVWLADLGGLF